MKKPQLELIILNFNTQYWLKKILQSIKEHYLSRTKYRVQVTVVDNNSQDDSVEMVKKQFSWAKLIELKENLGFAAANNVALKKTNSKYVTLLNSDVEFTIETNLDLLIDQLRKNPKIAVVTPKIELTNGEIDWACHRGEPTPWASISYFAKLEQLFPQYQKFGQYHLTFKDLTKPHLIDACSGAAMMVRTQAMKKVGYLDERFFMYAEDLDWCKRFRQAGYQIYYFPEVKIIHHKYKAGLKSLSPAQAFKTKQYFYNTMMQYYDKHYQNRYPAWVRSLIKLMLFIKKGGT